MRQFILKETGIIHACLIFVFFVPLIYTFLEERSKSMQLEIFIKGFWILVPLIFTAITAKKCKSFISYCVCNIAIAFITIAGMLFLVHEMKNQKLAFGLVLVITIQTIFTIWDRFMERLNKKEKEETKKQENPNWQPRHQLLEKPTFYALGYFFVIYIIGLNTASPILCNQALFATILYAVITLVYQFVDKTQTYFLINERVCNLPTKRIYGIKAMILLGFLAVLLFFMFISVATLNARSYHDIRNWTMSNPKEESQIKQTPDVVPPMTMDPMQDIKQLAGPQKQAPKWVDYMFDAMGAAVLLFVFFSILKAIKSSAKDFKKAYDENGDFVESLDGEGLLKRPSFKRKKEQGLSKREQIRREYKAYIRKHKKDVPDIFDSPYEIETKAGIEKEMETKKIHKIYEQARYDKEE